MPPISPEENLSRFIFQSNWYRTSNNTVKHAAFMPNPKNGGTSVFRTSGIKEKEIWDIGGEVSKKRGKPVSSRADIRAGNVVKNGLKTMPSEPPPRHANIVGWPEKSMQKMIAIELAADATLHLR